MPRSPEDEDFLLRRAALAPEADPPEELAPLVAEEEQKLLDTPAVDMTPPVLPAPKVAPLLSKDPYGPGADRAALEAALRDRQDSDIGATFQDAASLFNKAFRGHAGDLAASTRAHRDDSFNDVMRRRAMADQDAAAGKRQKEAEYDAAAGNGASDVSANARNLVLGSEMGKRLAERMGDNFNHLSAKQLGVSFKDLLASETDLAKAGLKASHAGPDESATALEALAKWADEKLPGLGDKVRTYGGTAKGLATARDVVHQAISQDFSLKEAEKGRTNTTAKSTEEQQVQDQTRKLSRLQTMGTEIKPEHASTLKVIKNLEDAIASNTNPAGEIAGTGLGHALVRTAQGVLPGIASQAIDAAKSQPAQDVQHALDLAYDLQRKGITGVVFTPREDAEYRMSLDNITNGHNVAQSVRKLKELSEAAVNRVYAAHPDVWRQYIKANPDLSTEMFNTNRPEDPTEASPLVHAPAPETAKARGINPAGFSPLPVKSEVKEPDRYSTPPQAKKVPDTKAPPADKPGFKTMEMPDGSFFYVPPDKVEEARARFKAVPVKSVRK